MNRGYGEIMGADLYWLEKDVRKHNGGQAMISMDAIIEVIDDDKPFKLERIGRIKEEYLENKRKV